MTLALWQLFEFIKTKKQATRFWGLLHRAGHAQQRAGGRCHPGICRGWSFVAEKEFRSFRDYRWYLGTLLALVVVSPALIGLMNQFGWDGLKFFFWDNNMGRITGSYVKAVNDPVFYVHTLAYLFLPWSLLFFIAAFVDIKTLIKNKFQAAEYFTVTGVWVYFIILNSASSQLPNYVFSIVPLIAVLTAKWIDIALEQKRNC